MSTTILRTPDAWWLLTPGGATRIDTHATSTKALLAEPERIEAARGTTTTVDPATLDVVSPVTAPRASSCIASRSSTSACWNVKLGWSARFVPVSASRCRLSAATILFSSTRRRASVVPMNPAPPVMKIRLP